MQLTTPGYAPQRSLTIVSGFLQTKCHQYWPDPPDVMDHGIFHVQCQAEDCTIAYVSREMLVTNTEVSVALRDMVEGQAQTGASAAMSPGWQRASVPCMELCHSQ